MGKRARTVMLTLMLSFTAAVTAWIPVQGAGWQQNDAGWWYQNENSTWPENEWREVEDKWYYFNGEGYRVSGWQQIDGGWYYFGKDNDGSMKTNTWVDEYYVGSDGRMLAATWAGNAWVDKTGKKDVSVKYSKKNPINSISLSKTGLVLLKDSTANLYVTCSPADTTDSKLIGWKSSDPAVATVSKGKVTAHAEGTAVITARVGQKVERCSVTVYDEPVCQSALSLLGGQYIWGGNGPEDGGVDCSGLLMYAYTQNSYDFGADLSADKFASYGQEISREELRPGDAICCVYGNGKYQHILLYLGNDMVVASECGGPAVCTAKLECNQHETGTACNCGVVKRPLNESDLLDAKFVRMSSYAS